MEPAAADTRSGRTEFVVTAIAELTRYPRSILQPDADLEEDLGIDSVKRAEIFGVLRSRLDLPQVDAAALAGIRTIGDIVAAVERSTEAASAIDPHRFGDPEGVTTGPATEAPGESPAAPARAATPVDLFEAVITAVAELTRYPRSILQPDADLEEDLGIDSVKRAEILGALRSRLNLPQAEAATLAGIRNVGDIVAAIERLTEARHGHLEKPVDEASAVGEAPVSGVPPRASAPERVLPPPRTESLTDSVIAAIAERTGHPNGFIQTTAHLEEDLGLGSRGRAEVVEALRSRLGIPPPGVDDLEAVRTVGDLLQAVERSASRTRGNAGSQAVPRVTAGALERASRAPAGEFAGKVALVTGSGHGLGKVIARHLAELGATVVVNSFHSRARGEETTAEIVADGGQAIHVWGSVANPVQLAGIFAEIGRRCAGLDLFVSSASNGVFAPLKDVSAEHWDRAFRTNVVGLHQGALLATELMRRRGGGRIVAISSPVSHRYAEHFGCLGPIKAAVESLTRYLAIELGPQNIQVNAVSAGAFYGETLAGELPDRERLIPYLESRTTFRQLLTERDVSELVVYLLSARARMVTGSVMLIDGGGTQRL